MPTSGTHITIVQRVVADPKHTPLLGNPDPSLAATDPAAIKMRFACLGAVGPDIFYAMADYGGDLQDRKVGRIVSGAESSITLGVVDSINHRRAPPRRVQVRDCPIFGVNAIAMISCC